MVDRSPGQSQVLTAEREAVLVAEARAGSPRAKHELIAAHQWLVRTVARRIIAQPSEDAIAEGTLALVEAFERYDPSFGTRFSTYAAHWVRAFVTRHALASRRMVGAPSTRAARRIYAGLARAERKLALTEAAPTAERIAAELGVTQHELEEVSLAHARDVSIGPGPEGHPDVDPPSSTASPEELFGHAEESMRVQQILALALSRLPDREQLIVRARQCEEESATLETLARALDLSRERVRQLERKALDQLGAELRAA